MNIKNIPKVEGWLSIFSNTILFVLKLWAGIVTNSIALIADAWHTLSDSISSVIVLLGIRVAAKEADEEHPFGHGQAEHIAAIVIAVLLALIGVNFLYDSIIKLTEQERTHYGTIALVVTIISVIAKEGMAQFAFWGYKKTNSGILKADGWHHRSDAISSVIILIGIAFGDVFWWIDGVLGILIAVFIIYTAYEIFKEASSPILGVKVTPELIEDIENMCESVGIEKSRPHHYHLHKYGNHTELTFHIKFPKNRTLDETHHLATLVENKIKEKYGYESTIHVEPESD